MGLRARPLINTPPRRAAATKAKVLRVANLLELYKNLSVAEQRQLANMLYKTGLFGTGSAAAASSIDTSQIDLSGYSPLVHNHTAGQIISGTLDGDRLPAMSTTKKGGVPATGEPSGKYLKDTGGFDTPEGTGGGATYVRNVNSGRLVYVDVDEIQWDGYDIGLYDATAGEWVLCIPASTPTAANTALDLDGNALVSGYNYDVFAEYQSETDFHLVFKKWTNDTTRAVTPAKWEGVYCYDNSTDAGKKRRYLGMVRLVDNSGTAEFRLSDAQRLVANWENQKAARIYVSEGTDHTYTGAAWRNWNNSATSTLSEFLILEPTTVMFCQKTSALLNYTNEQLNTALLINGTLYVGGVMSTFNANFNAYVQVQGVQSIPFPSAGYYTAIIQERSTSGGSGDYDTVNYSAVLMM